MVIMKKILKSSLVLVVCATFIAGMAFLAGCESADGLSGLTVTPSSATLTPASNTVTFVAGVSVTNSLALPVEWSLRDASLGSIIASTADSAIYKRSSKNGDNVITARDQYGNTGNATINQRSDAYDYVLTVTASPSSLSAGTNTCTVTVTGGVAPYQWSVADSSAGSILGSSEGSSIVYQASRAGSNAINVSDENGISASIAIIRY